MARHAAVRELEATLKATLPYFNRPPAMLKKRYAPGKWTMREILVHLSDTETALLDRLRRLAADPKPVLQAFDQDRWAKGLRYGQRDLKLARMQFEAARRGVLELVRLLPAAALKRTGTHTEYGKRSFAQVLHVTARHNTHHLEQLKAIAAGRVWKPK